MGRGKKGTCESGRWGRCERARWCHGRDGQYRRGAAQASLGCGCSERPMRPLGNQALRTSLSCEEELEEFSQLSLLCGRCGHGHGV